MKNERKTCPKISSKFFSIITLLTPLKKHTMFNIANSNKGTMNMVAPSKSNLPLSYFSSFSLSTALFVKLKFTFFLPKHFMVASKSPKRLPEINLITQILCSFHQVLIEPSLARTSYKCWKREDMYTATNTTNHGSETWNIQSRSYIKFNRHTWGLVSCKRIIIPCIKYMYHHSHNIGPCETHTL